MRAWGTLNEKGEVIQQLAHYQEDVAPAGFKVVQAERPLVENQGENKYQQDTAAAHEAEKHNHVYTIERASEVPKARRPSVEEPGSK